MPRTRTSTPSSLNLIRMVDWAHLKSELVWVYEGDVIPPYDNSRDHNPGQSALLLLRGRMRVETSVSAVEAHEGQWVFPRQGPRLQRFWDNPRVLSVHFNLYWPGGQPLYQWDTALVLNAADHPRLERRTRLLKRIVENVLPGVGGHLLWERGTLHTHFHFQSAFSSWLCVYVDLMEKTGIIPSRLSQIDERILYAVKRLDDQPLSEPFNERRLAAEVGLSPSQLYRLFTRQFSLTPKRYLEERRLRRAQDLIRSSPFSIKEITYETGFQSLPAFSRWFHQHTGQSPRQFKNSDRAD